jgi:hypothetical protein
MNFMVSEIKIILSLIGHNLFKVASMFFKATKVWESDRTAVSI